MSELGPLPLALIASITGSTLLVWHRHGGPAWVFVAGGFLFILGRLMIAGICAFLGLSFAPFVQNVTGGMQALYWLLSVAFFAIGGWSLFVIFSAVYRDAFGAMQQEVERPRQREA